MELVLRKESGHRDHCKPSILDLLEFKLVQISTSFFAEGEETKIARRAFAFSNPKSLRKGLALTGEHWLRYEIKHAI